MSEESTTTLNLNSEQIKLLSEGRLKAKLKLQEREKQTRNNLLQQQQQQKQQQSTSGNNNESTALNAKKRPLGVIPADSTSPTAPNTRTNPNRPAIRHNNSSSSSTLLQNAVASGSGSNNGNHFKRDDPNVPLKNMIGNYVEYDLAVLKNSKGGFLLDSEIDPRVLKEKKLMEENKLKRLENTRRQGLLYEPGIQLEKAANPICKHCGSMDLDLQLRAVFSVLVCSKCKQERPDDYSLLTKTECREDYLLTDPELKDEELLPHLLRPNPHRPTYSNMMLFLRQQVEAYAFSSAKWGSPEALDDEFNRREGEKREKKSKKFEKKLKELRKKTRTNVWHKRIDEKHEHEFINGQDDDGNSVQKCDECGFIVEVEVF